MTYQHDTFDPNLNNLHHSMEYAPDGKPHIRVTLGSDTITINGDVIIPTPLPITDNDGSLTVDGIVSISGPVGITGPISVTGPVSVTGTVSISTMPEVEIKNDTGNPIPISKDTNPNSATNRLYVSMETDVVVANSNYELNVARGLVSGQSIVLRSAFIPATSNTETSIWVEGGIYPHGTWTTAQRLFVVSSSSADTGQTITIEGLDSNYVYLTDQVVTNGVTGVLTTYSFLRIFTATITSASSNAANTGEIRFRLGSNAGTVVAHIGAGIGITKLSQYTVPAGHTAYIMYGDVATFKSGAGQQGAQVKMMVRPFNGSFIAAFIAECSNGYYRNDFKFPLAVLEKSDIDVRITTDSSGSTASSNYQMLLISNS